QDASFHLVLLATNMDGYKNLIHLSTKAFKEGFYYKPRVDKELLNLHSKGLIALSACLKGEVAYRYIKDDETAAQKSIGDYVDIFGKENFYLELQDHDIPEQKKLNPWLIEQAKKNGLKTVATNDCHYVNAEDHFAHDILMCLQTNSTLQDERRMRFQNDQFYVKDAREMQKIFSDVPEAILATREIANRCNLELKYSGFHLPQFYPPDGKDTKTYLHELCYANLQHRYQPITEQVIQRLEYELSMIQKMNFVSYFLIVWDFIRFAKENDIPVGPGRGSAAGSIVAYLLGITDIDPLKYDLLFERFLNPDRITMPDIDIDFCDESRSEVINYVVKKYGEENVAQIITFGTMGAKGVLRDVGRVMGRSYTEVDRIAKLVPLGPKISLKSALESEQELKTRYDKEPEVKELIDNAFRLEGMVRNASTHAAGIVISEKPLTEYVPLCRGTRGEITTQFTMGSIEKIGLLKMDFLGLRTLTVIHHCIKIIERTQGMKVDISKIPIDDSKTFELLNRAETIGVFQLESSGMRDLSRRIGVDHFETIIALVALYRPGPMHMVDDFIQRKHGKMKVVYDHPLLEDILQDTYGIMLYQEQVMMVASRMGGFTLAQADNLRRIMGKKIVEKMNEQRKLFLEGSKKNNITEKVAEKVFELMAYFAGYGFNKSHSAAYALIAYQTAYLKANYPVEYMASLLSSEMNDMDKLVKYINECRKMKIAVLPPDVNESYKKFTVVGKDIRFGLAAIKNVGENVVQLIIDERIRNGSFESFQNFMDRVDPKVANRKTIESLVKTGAFDSLGIKRKPLMDGLDHALTRASSMHRDMACGQTSFFGEIQEDHSAPFANSSLDTDEWSKDTKLAYEKELLGFYVTDHPLSGRIADLAMYRTDTIETLLSHRDGDEVLLGGIIHKVQLKTTKQGDKMAILQYEDDAGMTEVVLYPKSYEKYHVLCEEDAILYLKGRVEIRDEHVKLIASELIPFDLAPRLFAKTLMITLESEHIQEHDLKYLKEEFNKNKGSCPVKIRFIFPEGKRLGIQTGEDFKVMPTYALMSRLRE
ncbi:MAG: DNA polymerase III subunit alpha, partial [Chlamydiota bacterium]|nr:DNA polymerase III subunit alpha [Chlamydiota bacterium]